MVFKYKRFKNGMVFEDLTIIIKTFLRPNCLEKCISSIREFYPNIKILVADDSLPSHIKKRNDINKYLILPFDTGLSFGRNELLKEVTTPYFVLLDDDTIFTKETKLEYALYVLKNTNFDIVGGIYLPDKFYGNLRKSDDNKFLIRDFGYYEEVLDGYPVYDFVPNFFVGKTALVRKVGWCNELKVQEHTEFFWRGKGILKSTVLPYFTSINSHERNIELYNKFRFRKDIYFPKAYEKIGVLGFKDIRDKENIDLSKDKRLSVYAYKPFDFDTVFIQYSCLNQGYPIVITSCEKNKYKTIVQKDTWLKNGRCLEYYFLIGKPEMRENWKIEGDYLYLKCSDEYLGLPEKLVKAYEYFGKNRPDMKGVIKMDDDNYVNVKNLWRFVGSCWGKDYLGNSVCLFSKGDYESSLENRKRAEYVLTNYFRVKGITDYEYKVEISGRWYNGGHGYYLSRKSVETIINHFSVNEMNEMKEIYEDKMMADILRRYGIIEWDLSMPEKNKKVFDFRRKYEDDKQLLGLNINSFFIFCDVPVEKMGLLFGRDSMGDKDDKNGNIFYYKSSILVNEKIGVEVPEGNIIKSRVNFLRIDDSNRHRVFGVGVVQNPWERLYSLWFYLKNGGKGPVDVKNQLVGMTFRDFIVDYLVQNKGKYEIFEEQVNYLPKRGGKLGLDYVIKVEEMENQPDRIKQILKLNMKMEIRYEYVDEYNPQMLKVVNDLYGEDIRLLGYEFERNEVIEIDESDVPSEVRKMSEVDMPVGFKKPVGVKNERKEVGKSLGFKNIKMSNSKFLF